MEQPPAGPAPTDPYQWRESVLSTRSLSYISTVPDDNELPTTPRRSFAINPSYTIPNISHTRRNTLMSISSLGKQDEQDDQEEEEEEEEEEGLVIKQRQHQPPNNKKALNQTPRATQATKETIPPQQAQPSLPPSIANSPLYTLPLELRQLIYSYALSPSTPTEIPWPSTHLTANLHPSLLLTCRTIYAESARILYTTTNLSFSHPSDCNIFVRALASPLYAPLLPHFTLRIKSADLKLWTAYFNSHAKERSLVRDYPYLRGVSVRYSGLRYERRYTEEQNAHLWLKDPRLQELVLSVRKCSGDVRVSDKRGGRGEGRGRGTPETREGRVSASDARVAALSGRENNGAGIPESASASAPGTPTGPPLIRVALCVVVPEDVRAGLRDGRINSKLEAERCNAVIFLREAWLLGCYIRVECVEKEGLWR